MRKKIYLAIAQRLKNSGLDIPHISLWNNDLGPERLGGLKAFRTPAVFVEFDPIVWKQLSMGARDSDFRLRLHIVTSTPATPETSSKYQEQALAHLDLADRVNAVIQGFAGEGFGSMVLTGTVPDHSHDKLIHEELHYLTHVVDDSAARQLQSARPKPVITATITKPRQP